MEFEGEKWLGRFFRYLRFFLRVFLINYNRFVFLLFKKRIINIIL